MLIGRERKEMTEKDKDKEKEEEKKSGIRK